MKENLLLFILSLVFTACSHRAQDKRVENSGIAREGLEGSHYTAVQFDRGTSVLNEANKKFLNELAKKASRTGREIDEIKILAWADREYPKEGEKSKTRDVILANERAMVIRKFMKEDLNSDEPFDIFNMAKKPGMVDELLKDEEFQVKEDVADSGVSATRLPTGQTSYTKAGKVLVIIDYKELKQ
ncbi:MAG: hypothetical protein V4598_10280 [Bdellovibrionota bacterium]